MGELRADIYAVGAGALVGPAPPVLSFGYGARLAEIGDWSASFPAYDAKAANLTQGRELAVYSQDEGLIWRGMIDSAVTAIDAAGQAIMTCSGSSVSRELVHATTGPGLVFESAALSTILARLLPSPWIMGDVGSPVFAQTALYDMARIWEALAKTADKCGYFLRENAAERRIDMNAFGRMTGVVFRNVEAVSPNSYFAGQMTFPIQAIQFAGESTDVWNSVVPLGQQQGQGNAGSQARLTLQNATRSAPYTIQSAVRNGETYYYLEDAASVSAYGRREQGLQLKTEQPSDITTVALVSAANSLYDAAATWLTRHKDPVTSYAVTVPNFHQFAANPATYTAGFMVGDESGESYVGGDVTIGNSSPTKALYSVGDTIRVVFNGVVTDRLGVTTRPVAIDQDLYIMGYRRTFAPDGSDSVTFTLNTVQRQLPEGDDLAAQLYSGLLAVQTAPEPFYLFGNGQMRMDKLGLQLIASAGVGPSLGFVPSLQPVALDATAPYAVLRPSLTAGAASLSLLINNGSDAEDALTFERSGANSYLKSTQAIVLGSYAADPAHVEDGMLWYRSDTDKFWGRSNGVSAPLGGGALKTIAPGFTTLPAMPATPIACPTGTTDTYGAYQEFRSASGNALYITGYSIQTVIISTTYATLGIAIGNAGSEVAQGVFAVTANTPNVTSSVYYSGIAGIALPAWIPVAAGVRIACRLADSNAAATSYYVILHVIEQANVAAL